MGADTIMLKWRQLFNKLQKASASDTQDIFADLKEHEYYMVNKGYVIKFHEVISPTGETLWQRSDY